MPRLRWDGENLFSDIGQSGIIRPGQEIDVDEDDLSDYLDHRVGDNWTVLDDESGDDPHGDEDEDEGAGASEDSDADDEEPVEDDADSDAEGADQEAVDEAVGEVDPDGEDDEGDPPFDPGEKTVPELRDALEEGDFTDAELSALHSAEEDGEDRSTAKAAIEEEGDGVSEG